MKKLLFFIYIPDLSLYWMAVLMLSICCSYPFDFFHCPDRWCLSWLLSAYQIGLLSRSKASAPLAPLPTPFSPSPPQRQPLRAQPIPFYLSLLKWISPQRSTAICFRNRIQVWWIFRYDCQVFECYWLNPQLDLHKKWKILMTFWIQRVFLAQLDKKFMQFKTSISAHIQI